MKTNVKYCILCYVDEDKKTYNPGLILTNPAVDDEISDITMKMRAAGRRVRIFTSHLVDDIRELPCLDQPIDYGLREYRYDPWLMW